MFNNQCFFCDNVVSAFSITPIIQDAAGDLHEICEGCADREDPTWRDDEN